MEGWIALAILFIGGITALICAITGTTRALGAAVTAAVGLAVAVCLVSLLAGGSDHGMGIVVVVFGLFAGLPVLCFVGYLLWSCACGRPAAPIGGKARIGYAAAGIFLLLVGVVKLGWEENYGQRVFNAAIAQKSTHLLNFYASMGKVSYEDKKAVIELSPSLETVAMLRLLGVPPDDEQVWEKVLALPISPERLQVIKAVIDLPIVLGPGESPQQVNNVERKEHFAKRYLAKTVLRTLRSQGDTAGVQYLWTYLGDVAAILTAAAEAGDADLVRECLALGADPNGNKDNFLLLEARKHPEIVRILLEAGADANKKKPNPYTGTFLHEMAGNPELVAMLLAAGADPNALNHYNAPPLSSASDNEKSVRLMLAAGASPDVAGKQDYAPLFGAIRYGSDATVLALLQAKADLHIVNEEGSTPLHYAVLFRKHAVQQYLVARNVDVNTQDKHGVSPLHWAALFGDSESTAFLLESGATVEIPDAAGRTPLFYAVRGGSAPMLELLIQHADDAGKKLMGQRDAQGMSPLSLAVAQPDFLRDMLTIAEHVGVPVKLLPYDHYSNKRTNEQWKALVEQRLPVARSLLAAGARTDRVLAGGVTLFHFMFPRRDEGMLFSKAVFSQGSGYYSTGENPEVLYARTLRLFLDAGITPDWLDTTREVTRGDLCAKVRSHQLHDACTQVFKKWMEETNARKTPGK